MDNQTPPMLPQDIQSEVYKARIQQIFGLFGTLRKLRIELLMWDNDAPLETPLAEMINRESMLIVALTSKRPNPPEGENRPNA
jgi:hypothetical protein